MKKTFLGILIAFIIVTILLSVPAFAKQARETAELAYNNIKIFINGAELHPTDAAGNNVEPFIINGTTYLPVRAVAKAFDKNVSWDAETQSVLISDRIIYNKTEYQAYNEKISEYMEATTVGWDAFCNRWDMDSISVNTESVRAFYYYDLKPLAYALYDIDKNGVPELIFANLSDEEIYDVYTINDGSLIKLFKNASFGDRSHLHILADGTLLSEGASSAFESSMNIYSIKFGCTLSDGETFYFNTREDPIYDYYIDGTEISVDEYIEKLDTLKATSLFDKFDWVIFAQ